MAKRCSKDRGCFSSAAIGVFVGLAAAAALANCQGSSQLAIDSSVRVLDGDTFEQDGARYRMARIDTPELPGHCRAGRACASGDPWVAQQALQTFLAEGATCQLGKKDYYERTLVECFTQDGRNIGDEMLRQGYAQLYKGKRS